MIRLRTTKQLFPEFVRPLTPANLPLARSSAPSRETASQRILVIRTSANGDILMGTPLLAALRAAYPDAHITWMVERSDQEAIDANPYVDELLLWETMYWKKMTRRGLYPVWLTRAVRLWNLVRGKRFDTIISFEPEDWPMLTRFLSAHRRIGVFDTFREFHGATKTSRRARLYTDVYAYEDHPRHRVDQYLLPLRALGLPQPTASQKRLMIGYTENDKRDADAFIARELGSEPFVVVAPLTGWPSRSWPPERYAAVADRIAAQTGLRVVLTSGGNPKDRAVVEHIASLMTATRPVLAVGTFGFRALAAFIERAALVISGDTGPMHLASVFDTPYVALFGPSPVERFAPLVGRGLPLIHPVPCGPCHQYICPNEGDAHKLCMNLHTEDQVFDAACRLLKVVKSRKQPASAASPSEFGSGRPREPAAPTAAAR